MVTLVLKYIASTLAFMAGKLFTLKVLVRIAIIGVDHIVKASKPTWDDKLWKPLKEELEKEI